MATHDKAMPVIAIAVLAAGRSTRTGDFNKLLATFRGVPLVRYSVETALKVSRGQTFVIVGHMAAEISQVLSGLPAHIVFNHDYKDGLASSIKCAMKATPVPCLGIMIHLADMPLIDEWHIQRLLTAFEESGHTSIVRATANGEPGNPVILPRSLFDGIAKLEGDIGARHLISSSNLPIVDVEIGDAARIDVDTVSSLLAVGGSVPLR
jgi:molybdenum cofactor cytidylyltransferase